VSYCCQPAWSSWAGGTGTCRDGSTGCPGSRR